MKNLIIFSGHLGSTKKAAEMLSGMIGGATVFDTLDKPKVNFNDYDNVIFGTNMRMFMFNGRFKKYAKKWRKTKSDKKAFAFIIGASSEKAEEYVLKSKKYLGDNSFAVFAGGELNSENANGFAKSVIESVKSEIMANNKPLPTINEDALKKLSEQILK